MKSNYYKITALVNENTLESAIIEADSKKNAKYEVEQFWRENQLYEHKIVKIENSSYKEWINEIYGG